MMGISDWFKRLRAREDAQAVELAEERARDEGVPAGDLRPTRAASRKTRTNPSTRSSVGARHPTESRISHQVLPGIKEFPDHHERLDPIEREARRD
jgi:hypothetical protein